jgi:hypothetical protein
MISENEDQESSLEIPEVLGKRKSRALSQSLAIQDSELEPFYRAVKIQLPDKKLQTLHRIFEAQQVIPGLQSAILSSDFL